ncbi:MAG: hypothetical protein ACYCTY_05330 [Sulfuricella sp.]
MPKSLHTKIARYADREDVSLNTYLVTAISTFVGETNGLASSLSDLKKKKKKKRGRGDATLYFYLPPFSVDLVYLKGSVPFSRGVFKAEVSPF